MLQVNFGAFEESLTAYLVTVGRAPPLPRAPVCISTLQCARALLRKTSDYVLRPTRPLIGGEDGAPLRKTPDYVLRPTRPLIG